MSLEERGGVGRVEERRGVGTGESRRSDRVEILDATQRTQHEGRNQKPPGPQQQRFRNFEGDFKRLS